MDKKKDTSLAKIEANRIKAGQAFPTLIVQAAGNGFIHPREFETAIMWTID